MNAVLFGMKHMYTSELLYSSKVIFFQFLTLPADIHKLKSFTIIYLDEQGISPSW